MPEKKPIPHWFVYDDDRECWIGPLQTREEALAYGGEDPTLNCRYTTDGGKTYLEWKDDPRRGDYWIESKSGASGSYSLDHTLEQLIWTYGERLAEYYVSTSGNGLHTKPKAPDLLRADKFIEKHRDRAVELGLIRGTVSMFGEGKL